jgi:hypothetical protein
LTPGGSSTSHIYTQTVHIIQQYITHLHTNSTHNTEKGKIGKCGPCPVFVNYTLAFALQLRKKHGKTSVRAAQYKNNEAQYKNNEAQYKNSKK